MKLVKIKSLFDIEYGNQFDLNKLSLSDDLRQGVAFVSRTARNNGVSAWVEPKKLIPPYTAGLITVPLGGTLLSAFVQKYPFYTAQNIKVLTPKGKMTLKEKLFYCTIIKHNRFRYTSHGREANKTFNSILIPSREDATDCLKMIDNGVKKPSFDPYSANGKIQLSSKEWQYFYLTQFFNMEAGRYYPKKNYTKGKVPLVTASDQNNGVTGFTNLHPVYNNKHITIGKIGASTFFQKTPFCATPDVTVLTPKNEKFSSFIALFFITLINRESFKWHYGRQIRLGDCKRLKIKLPVKNGEPDWQFIENYIKSLPCSSNLS